MATIEVKVPPIGDFKDVPVIDVLVGPGETVRSDAPLVTLESEKATMDVPSPADGTLREIRVKVGDRVSEGTVVATLETAETSAAATPPKPVDREAGIPAAPKAPPALAPEQREGGGGTPAEGIAVPAPPAPTGPVEVKVPPIGDFHDVPVIEVEVHAGDRVQANDPLVTLESEKATMDVPSPEPGTVREVRVRAGDRVSEGSVVVVLDPEAPATARAPLPPSYAAPTPAPAPARPAVPAPAPAVSAPAAVAAGPSAAGEPRVGVPHGSPSVRRMARELGVDLAHVAGSGPKGRILREDVQRFVKETLAAAARPAGAGAGAGLSLAPWPKVDFAKYGPVDVQPLARIRKISAANLARNWVMIPHITQFDEADITDLERFRGELNRESAASGVKVTLLAFLMKACVAALRRFPEVNASLDGDQLVLKRYFHIGFAADTPNGLVVPVLRDADRKGVLEIARELGELAAKARAGKLGPGDMQGGSFSISSLGGIGGTAFTPIINAPEVAILGVSRSTTRPVWDGERFAPRLVLPLSFSYDHRVIDGALAARFTTFLVGLLGDLRRAML